LLKCRINRSRTMFSRRKKSLLYLYETPKKLEKSFEKKKRNPWRK